MRLAALAVVGILGAASALACDEEGGSLEEAAQVEKEAQGLLELGRKAEGAKLMAKAWAMRAEAWGADPRQPQDVLGAEYVAGARKKLAALKERAADLERAAQAAKEAGREAEAAERAAEAKRMRESLLVAERNLAERGGTHDLAEWRMKVAALKAKSEALEQAGKAAKAAGDEAAAKEKLEASGRVWKEAEALERKGGDGDVRYYRELVFSPKEMRLRRAENQARIEELEALLRRIEAGFEPGGEARKEEIRAKIEVLRAQVAALDEQAKSLHGAPARPKGDVAELADDVKRLRAEVREALEAVRALRAELGARADPK